MSVSNKCAHCDKALKKLSKSGKERKRNMLSPARLHAPVKNANPESIKITVHSISLRIPEKSEIEQIKFEIENKSIEIKDNSLTLLLLFQILATKIYFFSK